jgi:ABC-type sugar transport system permease subunit
MKFITSKKTMGYFFILPWMIGFLIFTFIPIAYSLYLSFNDVTITAMGIETSFIAFENFRRVALEDLDFLRKMWTFFIETIISVPLIVVLALIMALLLNQRVKGRGIFRTIFFLPVIINSGPVLNMLMDLEITTIPALERYEFYWALVAMSGNFFADLLLFFLNHFILLLWLSGVQILIFLAALQKTDQQIYEAARIDGASTWEIFWRITLPGLMPMILVNIVYTTVMYSMSALNQVTEYISANMFRIDTGFGYTSALSWIYFVIILATLGLLVGGFMVFEKRSIR